MILASSEIAGCILWRNTRLPPPPIYIRFRTPGEEVHSLITSRPRVRNQSHRFTRRARKPSRSSHQGLLFLLLHPPPFALNAKLHHPESVHNKPDTRLPIFDLGDDRIGKADGRGDTDSLFARVLPAAQIFAALFAITVRTAVFLVHIEAIQRELSFATATD